MRIFIRKYGAIMRVSLLNSMAYRHDFLFRGGFFVIILFIFRQIWLTVDPASRGMNINQLIWYLVITESMMLSFPDVNKRVDMDVKSGTIALLMVKPFHYPGYLFMLYSGELLPRFIVNIFLGAGAAYYFTGVNVIEANLMLPVLICMVFGAIMHFLIALLISLMSFWVEETEPFFWVYHKILFTLGGLLIPLEFLPDYLRNIAESLPFSVILYRPAMMAVNPSSNAFINLISVQILWCLVLLGATEAVYAAGRRRLCFNGG